MSENTNFFKSKIFNYELQKLERYVDNDECFCIRKLLRNEKNTITKIIDFKFIKHSYNDLITLHIYNLNKENEYTKFSSISVYHQEKHITIEKLIINDKEEIDDNVTKYINALNINFYYIDKRNDTNFAVSGTLIEEKKDVLIDKIYKILNKTDKFNNEQKDIIAYTFSFLIESEIIKINNNLKLFDFSD